MGGAFETLPAMPVGRSTSLNIEAPRLGRRARLQVVPCEDRSTPSAGGLRHELVVIDSRVTDAQFLLRDLLAQTDRRFDIAFLDAQHDGIEQISAIAARSNDLDAIHIVSHGDSGGLLLGRGRIGAGDVGSTAEWAKSLAPGADLLIYGCDVAAGPGGRALLDGLHRTTGADVAGSSNKTGVDGDWCFEYTSGVIDSRVAFSDWAQASYRGNLALFVVTSNAPTGTGSLAAAINSANLTAGLDTITFNIAGGGIRNIRPMATYTISESVIIDATTQPGYAGSPRVEIDGAILPAGSPAFLVNGAKSTIRGLAIFDAPAEGIALRGTGGHTVAGCWIGLNASGSQVGNGVNGVTIRSNDNIVGGSATSDRNIIAGNTGAGIRAELTARNTTIQGNWIGVDSAGTAKMANTGAGIHLLAGADSATVSDNVIAGNGTDGIIADNVSNLTARGNWIGTTSSGVAGLGNTRHGVSLINGTVDSIVGGTTAGQGNVIAFNGGIGINVIGPNDLTVGIQFLGNSIYSNGGLGIDLDGDGPTANDTGDGDSGANYDKNFPVLVSAVYNGSQITITGNYNSSGSNTYRLEFFVSTSMDVSGYGEGQNYIGSTTVVTDSKGNGTFNLTLPVTISPNSILSATATDTKILSTSEFSQSIAVTQLASIWLSTDGNASVPVTSGGVSWGDSSVVRFGEPNFVLGPSSTSGYFGSILNFNQFAADLKVDINGLDVVRTALTVGKGSSVSLLPGDILFSTRENEVLSGLAVTKRDVVVFRPTVPGDYSSGSFQVLFSNPGGTGNDVRDFALVQEPVIVGGKQLLPGDLIYAMSSATYDKDISLFRPTAAGLATAGTLSVLVDGNGSAGVGNSKHFYGIELITRPMIVGGVTLVPGQILASLHGPDVIGTNGLAVDEYDIFILDVTATGAGTSSATATMLFNGSMVGLSSGGERLDAIALSVGLPPILTMSTGTIGYTENSPGVIIDGTATLTDGDQSNYSGATLTVDFAAGGLAEDLLAIRNQGTGAGQVGVSGSIVTWGGVAIGTFSGGTGSTPLVVSFNNNSSVAAVQAVIRNLTYRNLSEAPDTTVRTVRVVVNDSSAGASSPGIQNIAVTAVNDAPVITVPGSQGVRDGSSLVFSSGTGNAIVVSDVDAGSGIMQVSLTASGGTLTLSGTIGLSFTVGDGMANSLMTFRGTVADINAALNGMSFVAPTNTVGGGTVTVQVDDLANSGNGGALTDSKAIGVSVWGAVVSPTTGLTTTEAGGTAVFSVRLRSAPAGNVTIPLSVSQPGEASLSVSSLTFTAANWNVAQTVTVTGVNDFVADGNIGYTIILGAATSVDVNYSGYDASDVSGINTDNDSAGIVVTPTTGLVTTEAGGKATFTVVLTSQPTATVTIPVSVSNPGEGTVTVSSLTFTAANWNVAQTVTVTGVDDFVADGAIGYTVVLAAATSGDAKYNGRDASDVSVTNADNDVAGVVVTPTSGLTTTEAGGQATFTVVLTSQPTADVVIPVAVSNPGEGTVSVTSLTFTTANWNLAQTVTVTGVDDFVADGNVSYTIVLGAATSGDAKYNGRDASDVSVTNTDNDVAGIVVTPTSGLTTSEAGGQATFMVVLTSQPTADVVIPVSVSNPGEGTVSVTSLTFTVANWIVAQTVTVTGVDDFVADGNVGYTVVLAPATSADGKYNGRDASDVGVTNTDNDVAGIVVTPTSGLTTSEAGGQAAFTVVLTSQPTADVVIPVSVSNPGEGTVTVSSLTFTAANWNVAQTVTVTGVDDFVADGNVGYMVVLGAATSTDGNYSGYDSSDVGVTNTDNDVAGIVVTPTSGLTTSEAGGQATFTVVLTSQPTADVVIPVSVSNPGEGTVSVTSLTFTAANWNVAQTVTVTGVDDFVADGDIGYTVVVGAASSADGKYNGRDASDVSVTNADNDVAGVVVTPTSGLTTSEAGGQATFTIVLTSQPTADVVIPVAVSNPGEGTVTVSSLTFTAANWNVAQTVTVTGVDDFVADGAIGYTVVLAPATSGDAKYNGRDASDVGVTNTDNDVAGIVVTPTSGLTTSEAGGQATFTVVLTSQPTATVTIPVSVSNPGEGTVSVTSLTFTVANWNVAQTVTVTGVDDFVADGNVGYTVVLAPATSADGKYNGRDASDVIVTNTDNDVAGIVVTPPSGLTTSETGGQATFTVVLTSQPTADVVIPVSVSNPGEGTVTVSSLTFTAANWNVAQTVTVTGVDDFVADGDIGYTVVVGAASSADGKYNGRDASDVGVTNTDNDVAGIVVTPTSGLTTSEAGGQATFTVVLTSQPTADVVIPVAVSNPGEGTVTVSSLTFTAANWNVAQTVTVTGVDDFVADGDIGYTVVLAAATSADGKYNGRDASDVSVTNTDNDVAGIVVTPTTGLVTTEAGGQATFTIVLTSQPTADVVIPVSVSSPGEGSVTVNSLTFTAANWNVAQTVTVTGVDDFVADGNVGYTIVLGAATSADGNYSGYDASDVGVTNTDNDVAGIVVTPTTGLITSEAGGQATFTVVLTSQPTADVVIPVAVSNPGEGSVTVNSLTFTAANWNVAQTVTVTGVDDFVADGNVGYTVVLAPATSADGKYNGRDASDVGVTNTDNDVAGIVVTPTTGLTTSEAGGQATFTVVLTSQPTVDVVIPVSVSNPGEGSVTVSSLTFTAANWNVAQTVTVTGVDDFVADGDIGYTVVVGAASSADGKYTGRDASDVGVTNTDNDVAGIVVTPTTGLVTTEAGGQATFTIVLTSQPTADVVIPVSVSSPGEGSVTVNSLTFTAANWNVAQTVTVTGVDDFVADGNVGYTIVLGAATSADGNYSGYDASDVGVTNTDNDVAGIVVTPTTGLITSEAGGQATFTVVLTSQPTADVVIPVAVSNPGEGTVSVTSLTFTTANWNLAQTVTVTGVDDFVADGDIGYTVVLAPATSADGKYNGRDASDIGVTNTDNDVAGIVVTPTNSLVTTEAGGNANFTVVLTSQPTANVVIPLSVSKTTEGTISVTSLTFTAANWNVAQTVTVTGVDDFVADGDIGYTVFLAAATSADSRYDRRDAVDVALSNHDNDHAAIIVTLTSSPFTSEAGGTAQFSLVLSSQPLGEVVIPVISTRPSEGSVDVTRLTFTSLDWNISQFVTVRGVDDKVADGNQAYLVQSGIARSLDAGYDGLQGADVALVNLDNDVAGVLIDTVGGTVVDPVTGTARVVVSLTSEPAASVVIEIVSANPREVAVDPTFITFGVSDWSVGHEVILRGVSSGQLSGDFLTRIEFLVSSADSSYDGRNLSTTARTTYHPPPASDAISPPFNPVRLMFGTGQNGAGVPESGIPSNPVVGRSDGDGTRLPSGGGGGEEMEAALALAANEAKAATAPNQSFVSAAQRLAGVETPRAASAFLAAATRSLVVPGSIVIPYAPPETYERLDQELAAEKVARASSVKLTLGTVVIASAGCVLWSLRGAAWLLSATVSAAPAWTVLDPLALLNAKRRARSRSAPDDDGESLADLAHSALT
ncbi:MAG: DUF4347 domain-containing protein [Gemmataceae bacterium]|nr:DUF4347 domain-containing protein [Gemmataceae bacterium]